MANKHKGLVATLFGFNDLLWSLLACFMVVTALLITQLQKPKPDVKTDDDRNAGSVSVYIFWRDGVDLDIDTHLSDPRGEHVYYAHTSGKVWNLLRDDLGMAGDTEKRNFENAYARGLPPGDYTINVHSYRGSPDLYPVTIEGEIRIADGASAANGKKQVLRQTITLYHTGEEATLIRFSIDAHGQLVPGSVNHVYKQLVQPG